MGLSLCVAGAAAEGRFSGRQRDPRPCVRTHTVGKDVRFTSVVKS
jgi:hypothetical protein